MFKLPEIFAMRFLHVSQKHDIEINKDTFKEPRIHNKGSMDQHTFNIDKALYLSKADENDSSMWIEVCKLLKRNKMVHLSLKDSVKDSLQKDSLQKDSLKDSLSDSLQKDLEEQSYDEYDCWINGKKFFFDVDFEKHKILFIDTIDDLRNFCVKYLALDQRVKYNKDEVIYKRDEDRFEKLLMLRILNAFIESLKESDKQLMTLAQDHPVKTNRSIRNMPYVKVLDKVVVPKKGITFEFLVDVVRTKEFFEKIIGDPSDLEIKTESDYIKYREIADDGWNGIYYSTNLIKFVENTDIGHTRYWGDLIQNIDIGYFPDVIPHIVEKDSKQIKDDVGHYLQWLRSDTLIILKWIF